MHKKICIYIYIYIYIWAIALVYIEYSLYLNHLQLEAIRWGVMITTQLLLLDYNIEYYNMTQITIIGLEHTFLVSVYRPL